MMELSVSSFRPLLAFKFPPEMFIKLPLTIIVPYQPGGEYLVWGQIPTGRAIISSISIMRLQRPVRLTTIVVQIENFLDPLPSHIDDVDPLCLGFITTAWKRVAVRSELSKKRLEKTYNSGLAFGRMVKAFNIPDYLTSGMISNHQYAVRALMSLKI